MALWFVPLLALFLLLGTGAAAAAEKNKCGCTRNESNNTCSCVRGAKCGCPGDCEPKGCEEKRELQRKKEIDLETKKAAEADRKHRASNGGGEMKQASAKGDAKEGSAKAETPPAPGAKKLSAAQVKQLATLLDGYLKQHPDARAKNAEELRNQLSLTPR